jgi:hypothetical protein
VLRKILSYGSVAGVIVGVPLFGMTVGLRRDLPAPYGMVVGYLIMLIALSTVFLAIKRQRDADLGGVITFWPAFGLGLGISVVAGVFYVLAWEAALATRLVVGYYRIYVDDPFGNRIELLEPDYGSSSY